MGLWRYAFKFSRPWCRWRLWSWFWHWMGFWNRVWLSIPQF